MQRNKGSKSFSTDVTSDSDSTMHSSEENNNTKNTTAPKKTNKRKISDDEKEWHPRHERKGKNNKKFKSNNNSFTAIFSYLTRQEKTDDKTQDNNHNNNQTNKENKNTLNKTPTKKEKKVSIIFENFSSMVDEDQQDTFKRATQRNLKDIKNHTPARKVIRESENKTPLVVQSSQGTNLFLSQKTNSKSNEPRILIYSTELTTPNKFQDNIPVVSTDVLDHETVKHHILPNPLPIKEFEFTVTSEKIKKREQEKKLGKTRIPNAKTMKQEGVQNKLAAAKNLALAIGLMLAKRMQWLHTAPDFIVGEEGQDPKKIVGGTDLANGEMLCVEVNLPNIAKEFPEGFKVKGRAHMMTVENEDKSIQQPLQIAKLIEYELHLPGIKKPLKFEFNPLRDTAPEIVLKDAVNAATMGMITVIKKQDENSINNIGINNISNNVANLINQTPINSNIFTPAGKKSKPAISNSPVEIDSFDEINNRNLETPKTKR